MAVQVNLFSIIDTKKSKTGMIAVLASEKDDEPQHIHQVDDRNATTDFAALRFLAETNPGWNNDLDVALYVSPETFDSDHYLQNWLEEVKNSQALLRSQLFVLVQSTVNRERFEKKVDVLTDLQASGIKVGIEIVGGMGDANSWRSEFPWDITQLNLDECRESFSLFAVYTSQMHKQGVKNLVVDVHDRTELITVEQIYVDYASGPVFGKACLWNGPLSHIN